MYSITSNWAYSSCNSLLPSLPTQYLGSGRIFSTSGSAQINSDKYQKFWFRIRPLAESSQKSREVFFMTCSNVRKVLKRWLSIYWPFYVNLTFWNMHFFVKFYKNVLWKSLLPILIQTLLFKISGLEAIKLFSSIPSYIRVSVIFQIFDLTLIDILQGRKHISQWHLMRRSLYCWHGLFPPPVVGGRRWRHNLYLCW